MLNIIALLFQLTIFVDSCDADARVCVVYAGITDEDDAGPLTVSMDVLPACAAESMLVNVASGTCDRPRDYPHGYPTDNGSDIDLNDTTPADHSTYCPATSGHKAR